VLRVTARHMESAQKKQSSGLQTGVHKKKRDQTGGESPAGSHPRTTDLRVDLVVGGGPKK